jgi:hypothetical protein
MNQAKIAQAIINLDTWLETMRQSGGYGGPVSHWWQNRFQYTGPGLDWRYEGILIGYKILYEKTLSPLWRRRLNQAALDLMRSQLQEGSYQASRFEINPGVLGTPHEAAATLGLLEAYSYLEEQERAFHVAEGNLQNLIRQLWDGKSFNDGPGYPSRVPNKLATFAMALMTIGDFCKETERKGYLSYANAALAELEKFYIQDGHYAGAIGQGSPNGETRYFPYYIARCVPALVAGSEKFKNQAYLDIAIASISFLERSMRDDGSWPQIIYADGKVAHWPSWIAGSADILYAIYLVKAAVPSVALQRLLSGQLASGGFSCADGFANQINQLQHLTHKDFRDVIPIVGWNDKTLRLLATFYDATHPLPQTTVTPSEEKVMIGKESAVFYEDKTTYLLKTANEVVYEAHKQEPWARICRDKVNVR